MRSTLFVIILGLLLLTAPLVSGHAQPGEGDWDERWHDFGEELGGLGPSPVPGPLGVCWFTDAALFDIQDPDNPRLDADVREVNYHKGGVAVGDGCAQELEGQESEGISHVTVEGGSSQLGSPCGTACRANFVDLFVNATVDPDPIDVPRFETETPGVDLETGDVDVTVNGQSVLLVNGVSVTLPGFPVGVGGAPVVLPSVSANVPIIIVHPATLL